MKTSEQRRPPKEINGTPVFVSGEPQEIADGLWVTLVPEDDNDGRLWEFDTRHGRLLLTNNGED